MNRKLADLPVNTRSILVQVLAFACISFAFSLIVIKDFSRPLAGVGDANIWEYMGYYFAKNLNFTPFPQLNLSNNQVFYPYGINSVFQGWGIERDIFYAIFYSFFGLGPWLQIYYLLSVLLTAIGTCLLLIKDYGFVRANGAGIIVAFFGFYAINKYPVFLDTSIVHWTVISFVADFLIVKRSVLRQNISLRFILIRISLLILSMGQGLGYIAGFALTSFTISILFITLLLSYRYLTGKLRLTKLFKGVEAYQVELVTYPRQGLGLLLIIMIIGFLYMPLVFQISREAKSFDFTGVPSGVHWSSLYRLLIPYLPGVNPALPFELIFHDSNQSMGGSSPGWFLLIIGTVGLWQSRQRITIYIPLLTIFLLCLVYNPEAFPVLRIFPWFAFNRVADRSTVIYPVILCIFALDINFNKLRFPGRQLLVGLLVCLACTELYTAYYLVNYQPYLVNKRLQRLPTYFYPYPFDKNFFTYMNYVKKQPGEAVLDWPFCVAGGNGIGMNQGLCPYYRFTDGIYALKRFHEKKVIGFVPGRLHPSQIEPFLQAGWNNLFSPDKPNFLEGTRQTRCFKPEEWSFFTDFYKFNDFAGINLYVDLLPEGCASEFYKRFGTPVMESRVPPGSRVQFLPKSPELRRQVNLALGKSIRFEPTLDLAESNLLEVQSPYGLTVTGLFNIENNGPAERWRWAVGPETLLSFRLRDSKPLELTLRFVNPIEGQEVAVEINGVSVANISNIRAGEIIERRIKFEGGAGVNRLIFRAKDWNHHKTTFAPNDPSPLAIQFKELAISSAQD